MQRTIAPPDALKTLSAPAPLTADGRGLLTLNLELTASSPIPCTLLNITTPSGIADSIKTYIVHNGIVQNEPGGSDGQSWS